MKIRSLVPAVVLSTVIAPATAVAETTANFGWVSDYIFRGLFQEDSSASAGVDYTHDSGFYVGTWGADVGQGLETDLYLGFARGDKFTYKIGFTGYYYTDDFDDTYSEVNLGLGYGIFALDVAIGQYDGRGVPADYTFTSVTISPEKGPYYRIGSWSDDFEPLGEYFELGYTYTLEGPDVDLSITLWHAPDSPLGDLDDNESGDSKLTFGIKKNISFGD